MFQGYCTDNANDKDGASRPPPVATAYYFEVHTYIMSFISYIAQKIDKLVFIYLLIPVLTTLAPNFNHP